MRIIYATNLHEHPVRHFVRIRDIHPSSRENWKGWRSHECAVEFRELLNEPSSRKPLITKGLGEKRARAGKEKPIFGEGSKPQIFREKFSGTAAALHLHYFLKIDCTVRLVRTQSENHEVEKTKEKINEKKFFVFLCFFFLWKQVGSRMACLQSE